MKVRDLAIVMCFFGLMCSLILWSSVAQAAVDIPANTWVQKNPTETTYPPGFNGGFGYRAWGRMVYRPINQSILFYEGYGDGGPRGSTIYANTLYEWQVHEDKLTGVKISNWGIGPPDYPLPENDTDPTPANRHTYRGFEYVPTKDAVYLVGGANSRTPGLDLKSLWKYSFLDNSWRKLSQPSVSGYEGHLNFVSATNSLYYMVSSKVWKFDLDSETWGQISVSSPSFWKSSSTVDTKRNVIVFFGGDGTRDLRIFNPVTNTFTTISTNPSISEGRIAYNSKWDVYIVIGTANPETWIYHLTTNEWEKLEVPSKPPVFHNEYETIGYIAYDQANDLVVIFGYRNYWVIRYVPSDVPPGPAASLTPPTRLRVLSVK